MAENDLDVEGLAKYLHLSPQQVERLVSRGQIPARRVAGNWKFNHADIHHWMEERMGVLETADLVRVEGAMAPYSETDPDMLLLKGMLCLETIAVPLTAKTRNAVIDQMAQLAATTGMLWDPEKMADAVRNREQLQSTAMDNGVALLHSRRPLPSILGEPILAVGITPAGIPFGGSRHLTDIFFLLCSTDDRGHLRALARLARMLNEEGFVDSLRHVADATEALDLICRIEEQLPS